MLTAQLQEAIACYRHGDLVAALRGFDDILRVEPNHSDALRLRGLAMVKAGEPQAALPLLARAWGLAQHDPLSHLHYGIGLLQAGCHARAAALFRRAAMMSPDNPAPWANLSVALLALGQNRAARAAARRAVAAGPGSAECWHALGVAHRAMADHAAARDAFVRAVTLNAGLANVWVDLGLAAYQLADLAAAESAMRAAMAAHPGHAAAEANLAAFLVLRGDTEQALRRLRAVLQRDPGCVAARLNLANTLLLDNEPEQALAQLHGTVPAGRDGRHWRAHRAMALLSLGRKAAARAELDAIPRPYGDAEILILWRRMALLPPEDPSADTLAGRMTELAADETATVLEHRIIARFDLARFHNRRRQSDTAFAHWTEAHRLLARLQPFSRDQFSAFIDAVIANYDTRRLTQGARAANRDRTPVFIVGLPRSGTSLMEQVLAAHAQIHGAGERAALHRLLNELAGGAELAEAVPRAAGLDAAVLDHTAEAYLGELHALAPAARLITDKMPGNARHLGFIATLLPGARIIHCTREPRDIGLSIFQHRFFGYHPYAHDLADLGWAIGQHARLMAHWRAVLPIPMIEVALADWVDDFAGTLARVLDFLDLPYDPACALFHQQQRRVRTASARQVRQPINARGIGRWRPYEAQLAPLIAELNSAGLLGEPVKQPEQLEGSVGP